LDGDQQSNAGETSAADAAVAAGIDLAKSTLLAAAAD
jgi:hypothetical protein